jgi:hypothetical protein
MEYNTSRDHLIIPEYGRHVQGMIQRAKEIADPKERQAFVERVVDLVVQMNAQSKNIEDFREKVWKHVFRIANFEIDVIPPGGEVPTPEDVFKKPDQVAYPHKEIRYRHYGYNVQTLIQKAIAMEEGPKKEAFTYIIASYMKLAYQTWNKEHFVSDDVVLSDLEALSQGKLSLHESTTLADPALAQQQFPQQHQQRSKGKQQGQYRNNKQKYQGKGGSGSGSSSSGGGYKRKRNKRK